MRIKELRVHRYGPLADKAFPDLGDFTLIFGENEAGKTLLLDAILRFLLARKKERQLFSRLDRVEHDPDGFIDILYADQVFRFPDQGSLADLLGIHASDLRNVFIVRAGDLQIQEEEDNIYYSEVTERLVGIHRAAITKIKKGLLNLGRITQKGNLSDSKDYDKIASKVKVAAALLSRIEDLHQDVAETDMVALEAKMLEAQERRIEVSEELELFAQAKKRQQYEEGSKLLADLERCIKDIEALPAIEQKHYNAWRDAERDIGKTSLELKETQQDLEKITQDLKEAEEELRKAAAHYQQMQNHKQEIDDLRRRAEEHRQRTLAEHGRSTLASQLPKVSGLLALLTGLAFLAILLDVQRGFFMIAASILGLLFIIASSAWAVHALREGRLRREWAGLQMDAASAGIKVDDLDGLLQAIGAFDRELERAQQNRLAAQTRKETAEIRVQDRDKDIKKARKRIEKAQSSLRELGTGLGLASFEELEETKAKLDRLQTRKKELLAALAARFGDAEGRMEERMEFWRAQIQQLAPYKEAAMDISYHEARETELSEERSTLEGRIDEIERQLNGIRDEIADIVSQASPLLAVEEPLPGETLEDLRGFEKQLRAFVYEVEERAKLAWRAYEIFENIKEEEQQKVQDLFGGDDTASHYFRLITGGAYHRVVYVPESHELKVVKPDGASLRAYQLSSGTYDQLYLATRLSLAQRILDGEPGFLLLDDPFLTSDSKRLARQLEILQQLAAQGWQIVYFSVKDEIKAGLETAIGAGKVALEELASIHPSRS